jgi:uncharacterized protein YdeI (BOF family)
MAAEAALTLALVLLLGGPNAPAQPFERVPGPVVTIAEVREHAELYRDRATIEGEVVSTRGRELFEIEDATGTMLVYVPWSLQSQGAKPKVHDRVRVRGKYSQKPLAEHVRGLHVSALHVLDSD